MGIVCRKGLGGRVSCHTRTDLSRGVGHGADAISGFWKSGLNTTERRARKDGEDKGICSCLRKGGVDLRKLLWFAGEDEGVCFADRRGKVGEIMDTGGCCEIRSGRVVATSTSDGIWGVMVVL